MNIPRPKVTQLYATAYEFKGGSRLTVQCDDGKVRMGRIPGKIRKRAWIKLGDLLIIEPWVVQGDTKCDVKYRFTRTERERIGK